LPPRRNIGARAAVECIIAIVAKKPVITVIAEQKVIVRFAVKPVTIFATSQGVIAVPTMELIEASAAVKPIVTAQA
jgi:hypothetical protein